MRRRATSMRSYGKQAEAFCGGAAFLHQGRFNLRLTSGDRNHKQDEARQDCSIAKVSRQPSNTKVQRYFGYSRRTKSV